MKIPGFLALLAVFITGLNCAAADTNASPFLMVDLRDGSRIIGQSLEKKISFHSALLGDMKLQVEDIRSVECLSSNSAMLSTAAGDTLTVTFVDSELEVKTSFGKVELPVDSIRRFTVESALAAAHPSGLVALWTGQGEGKDSVGSNDGSLTNITFVDSPTGPAFHLDGTDSYIEVPDSPALRPRSITISAWVKFDVDESPNANQPGQQNIVFKLNSRDPHQGNFTGYNLLKNSNHFSLVVGSPEGQQVFANSQAVPQVGIWYHVAATYDSDTGEARVYVNGRPDGSAYAGFPLDCGTEPLFIGTTHEWWDGKLKGDVNRIEIYNRALSADEIKSICLDENGGQLPPATRININQMGDYPNMRRGFPTSGLPYYRIPPSQP